MNIDWPPFPPDVGMLDHAATEEDLAAGRAAFVIRDSAGRLRGSAMPLGMNRLGFILNDEKPRLGVAVQVESNGDHWAVGVLHSDDTFSVCTLKEFKEAPRCLILFDKPGYTLDQAEFNWTKRPSTRFKTARRQDVLAVRWDEGPVLFIRYASGEVVTQEIALIRHPRAEELKQCTALFEVSFLDLDEMLDEINTLIDVQSDLQMATGGFLYLEWNGNLSAPDE